ncbi:hypothetical protein HMPREF9182_1112 [Streptococcus sp. oral taxon 056 str. F0418]|uniref:hypothetical protein n=1 Tax=Streptococcus sp. oral taxon 056 TaxID=712620 RepID=UPI0002181788|nr:hypothetical protein [Streptococcus sp. oral taxon 056]EGP65807.1 hypothetical protein HMPREF9182_1112 [Streptococcus sp. oral taxon 056 str. F0418]
MTTDSKKHLEATISEEKPKVRALRSVGTTATAVPRTEKSKQYIESIKGEYKYNNAVYTIRTKEDVTELSFEAFNASTGDIHESKSIEKINNRTFEARLLSPLKGDWRPFSMQLATEDGIVKLNRKDLLDQRVSILIKGATREVDQNLTLKNGKQIIVAMNKSSAINTDIIKYTIKVAGETYSDVFTIELINDRTGKIHSYTPGYGTRSLDDNGNTVIYYKVDTTKLDHGNYRLHGIWYKKGGETQSVKYPNFSYQDNKTSFAIGGAKPEPTVEPKLGTKKIGYYVNYIQALRGTPIIYTAKVNKGEVSYFLHLKNSQSGLKKRFSQTSVDSNGNPLFHISTADLPTGTYTIDSPEIGWRTKDEDFELSDASVRIVEKGVSIRRKASMIEADRQFNPGSSSDTKTKPSEVVTRTKKAIKYIESITGMNKFGNVVYTIKTKTEMSRLTSAQAFDAHTGAVDEVSSKANIKKINNRTFEVIFVGSNAGDWRPYSLYFYDINNESVKLTRRDLLDQRVGVLNKGASREIEQNPVINTGQKVDVAVNKRNVKKGDIVKYTLKIADKNISGIRYLRLMNGAVETLLSSYPKHFDDNGNAIIYYTVSEDAAVYYLKNIEYEDKAGKSITIDREILYPLDKRTVVTVNGTKPEKMVQPRMAANTQVGVFADHSQIKRGDMLTYTVTPYKRRGLSILSLKNTQSSFSRDISAATLDSNGNYIFHVPTWDLPIGTYTVEKYFFTLDKIIFDLTDATFTVVEKGNSIKRNPTPIHRDKWVGKNYYDANGELVKSKWLFDKKYGSWFYLNAKGEYIENQWHGDYYLKQGGQMAQKEWIFDKKYNSYFYLKTDGKYARNEWSGDYYLKANGIRAQKEWIFDKKYNGYFYLKTDGKYARNEWSGDYYLKANGIRAQKEWIFDKKYNGYFYLKADGKYARNEWIGDYYLERNGIMAMNKWIGQYYVDANGKKR